MFNRFQASSANFVTFSRLLGLWAILFLLGDVGLATATGRKGSLLSAGARRSLHLRDWNLGQPSGLAYAAQFRYFFTLDRSDGNPTFTTLLTFTAYEELIDQVKIDFGIGDAINLAYDEQGGRLLLFDQQRMEIAQVALDEQGKPNPATLQRRSLGHLDLVNAVGMAVDGVGQRLLFLDKAARRVISLPLNAALDFPAQSVTSIDLAPLKGADVRGLALHPAAGTLLIGSPSEQLLYEVTQSGALVNRYTLAQLAHNGLQTFVFAPSADVTDPADTVHLFVADRGMPNGQKTRDTMAAAIQPTPARSGAIMEVALNWSPDAVSAAAAPVVLTLVKRVNTNTFTPSSPDPSGVVFIPALNRLLISDSEVDEMPALFTGANLFEATTVGTSVRSGSTSAYSTEPTGVGFNPANGHLFIADDTKRKIFEVATGPDGLYGNGDDVVTSFDTASFNCLDPEDVTYDTTAGVLFIVDGISAEVYKVSPGANGRFDGIPAAGGDDLVTNFDVQSLYIYDPEGIHYDAASDHLFLVANNRARLYEITTTGALVQLYDTSAANITKNAGVTMAPSSNNPGVTNFYIVDSGIDNDVDPTENDGKLIELSRNPNPTPTQTPTPDPTLDAVFVGAGDIASCLSTNDEATANLLDGIVGTVFTVGDHVYDDETLQRFDNCYAGSWGRYKARTMPALGNHEYHVPGATDYFAYFGAAAGDPQKGYYSYDLGAWHIIVLNSECAEVGGCKAGSPQEQWLRADLAAHPNICTLAYWHAPRFSSGVHGNHPTMRAFWQALYDYGADVVLNGHDHNYERFARQNADGIADPTRGIREFVIGTGGGSLYTVGAPIANSEVRNNDTHGVLKLLLRPTSYSWEFIPVAGKSFTDTGSEACITYQPPVGTGTPTPTGTSIPTSISTPTSTSTPLNTPTPTSTPTPSPTAALGDLFLSLRDGGTLGGVGYKDEDILSYDNNTGQWALFFDGSDVGISNDVDAFAFLSDGSILLSFEIETTVNGLGWVDDSDIVQFTPTQLGGTTNGTFAWYFDGSDVELTTDAEDIDAITLLNGAFLLSTLDDPMVAYITGSDEDLLRFIPSQLGATTAGTWSLYFDGSDVGLNDSTTEDVQGAYIDPATGVIYLSTRGAFSVTGVSGNGADIFTCTPLSLGSNTNCTFSLFWNGSTHGLIPETIDAFALSASQTVMTAWSKIITTQNSPDEPGTEPGGDHEQTDDYHIFLPVVHG